MGKKLLVSQKNAPQLEGGGSLYIKKEKKKKEEDLFAGNRCHFQGKEEEVLASVSGTRRKGGKVYSRGGRRKRHSLPALKAASLKGGGKKKEISSTRGGKSVSSIYPERDKRN